MNTINGDLFAMRDVEVGDIPALIALRPDDAHHRGRLRDAQHADFRYFALLRGSEMIGFVCLIFRRPVSWSNADDTRHLPEIVDLHLTESQRGHGYGTAAIHALEHKVTSAGYQQVYIAVEPQTNPRAYALYHRLGFRPLQAAPYQHVWKAVDGDGVTKSGEAWLMNMVKSL